MDVNKFEALAANVRAAKARKVAAIEASENARDEVACAHQSEATAYEEFAKYCRESAGFSSDSFGPR